MTVTKKKKKKKESPFHELSYSLENPTSTLISLIDRTRIRPHSRVRSRVKGNPRNRRWLVFNNYRNGDAERSLVNRAA